MRLFDMMLACDWREDLYFPLLLDYLLRRGEVGEIGGIRTRAGVDRFGSSLRLKIPETESVGLAAALIVQGLLFGQR